MRPLEAAYVAISDFWFNHPNMAADDRMHAMARAALLAAIKELPQDAIQRTECPLNEYERIMDEASSIREAGSVMFERDRQALRRAFGIEEGQ